MQNELKSRVSSFVAAILCMSLLQLVISDTAKAAGGIGLYISPPLVQGPPASYNANIETYALPFVLSNPSTFQYGWIFDGNAGFLQDQWGGATTTTDAQTTGGTFSRYIYPTDSSSFNVTFPSEVRYVGFYWPSGNTGNTVHLYTNASDSVPVATFTSVDLTTAIGNNPSPYPGTQTLTAINGNTYLRGLYFNHPKSFDPTTGLPSGEGANSETHAFVNILASGNYSFKKITFTGNGFESDNLSITTSNQTADPQFVFIKSILGKSVTFRANSGSGTMTPQVSDGSSNLVANQFNRSGHSFSGWNTSADGTGTPYSNNGIYSFATDLTLYAQWSPLTYSITFFDSNTASAEGADGGSAPASQSDSGVSAVGLNANTLSLTNHTFAGWATSNGSTTVAYTDSATVTINSNTVLSLYPVWNRSNFTITSSADVNGSISASGTTTVNRGGNQSYSFSPISGYRISDVLVNGLSQGSISTYTFSNVVSDHTIRVLFELIPVVNQAPAPIYIPQKSAEQLAAEVAAQKLADEKAAEQLAAEAAAQKLAEEKAAEFLAAQQKARAEMDKILKELEEQLSILENTKLIPKSTSTTKASSKTTPKTNKVDTSIPNGTVLITPNQIAQLDLTKTIGGSSANVSISQLKSGQRVKITVISKMEVSTKVIDLDSTTIVSIAPGPIKPTPSVNPTLIDIKPASKLGTAASNKAKISVSDAKKNQRVRVTVKSK